MAPEDNPADDELDICGLCGHPGADKMTSHSGIYWPGEQRSRTDYVHAECEKAESERAFAALTPAEREAFMRELMRGLGL